ncbi:DUF2089 domain-containing protein [Bifidobacterium tsurumiense]|nr:DUF2089 family protein [Bifidobacterium tsurumiense]MDY4678579.1 DUF2089 family protein [Bifidobacterium tsurumiense]MSS12603.1 DUF2089 domain-containing protein [Bifidobacterium tsurumiense]
MLLSCVSNVRICSTQLKNELTQLTAHFNIINIILSLLKKGSGMKHLPEWLANLADEDIAFIKNFMLASGSLKRMAQLYQVSYPTMRVRLDKLIDKIRLNDSGDEDPFVLLVKSLAIDEKYDVDTARILIEEYRKRKDER